MPTNDAPDSTTAPAAGGKPAAAGAAPAQGSRTPITSTAPKKESQVAGGSQRTPSQGEKGDSQPVQTEGATLASALQERGIRPGPNTASGLAASPETYEKVEDTAAKEVASGEPSAKPGENSPAQQPGTATFLINGQLEAGSLPSNQGPVPASVSGQDNAAALGVSHAESVKQQQKLLYEPFTEAQVNNMGRAEVRAHAEQRGYDIGEAGTRVLRARLLDKQKEDKNLQGADKKEPESATAGATSQNIGGLQVGIPAAKGGGTENSETTATPAK